MTLTTTQFCQIVFSASFIGGSVGWVIGYWRVLIAYLLLSAGAIIGYFIAALMFTARDSESAGRYR